MKTRGLCALINPKCIMMRVSTSPDTTEQLWSSGMMLACHAGDPGSIPGSCILLFALPSSRTARGGRGLAAMAGTG